MSGRRGGECLSRGEVHVLSRVRVKASFLLRCFSCFVDHSSYSVEWGVHVRPKQAFGHDDLIIQRTSAS